MVSKNTCGFWLLSTVVCLLLAGCGTAINKTDTTAETYGWQRVGPGGGGATFIPTFSYHNVNNFLVRCDMTGAYITSNGGESYNQINNANGSHSFAYDPADSNTIYIGSLVLNKSADGGKTWQQIFPAKKDVVSGRFVGDHAEYEIKTGDTALAQNRLEEITAIRVDPLQKGALYFANGNNFYYTANGGETWAKKTLGHRIQYIYTNTSTLKDEVYIFTEDSTFIFHKNNAAITGNALPAAVRPAGSFTAGTVKGSGKTIFYALHNIAGSVNTFAFAHCEVWRSTDFGATWQPSADSVITNQRFASKPSLIKLVCAEMDAANAYVVANQYTETLNGKAVNWYGALKTADAGNTWHWVWKGGGGAGEYGVQDAADAPNLTDAWVHKAFGGEFIQLMDAGVAPYDGNTAIVTDWYRTMKTVDGGNTWREVYSIKQPDDTYTSRGMDVTTTYGVHFDPFDSNHIAISYTDIGCHQSFNGGKSWARSVTGVPGGWVNTCYWMVFDPAVKNKVWSVWSEMHDIPRGKMTRDPNWKKSPVAAGGVCVSTDGGRNWQPTVQGMGGNSPATSIIIDPTSPAGHRTLYVTVYNKGVFKSTDDGNTWQLKNTGIDSNTCAFKITRASDGSLFLTVSPTPQHKDGKKGAAFYPGAVYKSTNGAESWVKLSIASGLLFPNGVSVDPANPKRVYVSCWADVTLSDLVGGDVAKANGGNRELHTPGGIFMSEDGGNTWKSIFDDKQYVYDVTVDPYHPGRLYCNTFNKAAWRSNDFGHTWHKIKGYDFHWGHRVMVDENDHEKVYITTFGSSVWHGVPEFE